MNRYRRRRLLVAALERKAQRIEERLDRMMLITRIWPRHASEGADVELREQIMRVLSASFERNRRDLASMVRLRNRLGAKR